MKTITYDENLWVLVPREPSFAMRNTFVAGMGSSTYYTHTTLQCEDFDSRYRLMLAAAPSAEGVS